MEEKNQEIIEEVSAQEKPKYSIAGFVLGIISIFAWILPLAGYPVSIVGLVLSVKARREPGNTFALVGMILSIIGLCLTGLNSFAGVLLSLVQL